MPHHDATTEDYPRVIEIPASASGSGSASANPPEERHAPDRRIIEGSAPNLQRETRDLLHRRLFAASLILAICFAVLLVRDWFFPPVLQRATVIHGCVLGVLIANLVALSSRWRPSMRQLRILELATFGIIIACFICNQSMGLSTRVRLDMLDAGSLRLLFKNSIIGTLILIFTYGIFIPNDWKRAARIIIPMAGAPLVAPLVLGLTSAEFRTVWQEVGTAERLSENGLFLVLGAVTAIYGTHIINTFRTQVFEERSLNQYRLIRRLGAGGMGEVFLAQHQLLKRPCAIKLIRPELTVKPRVLARFELEVTATARLSHWNTVEVYDYGRSERGTFFYVMEYLPGLSLQDLVERHGPLPPGRVIHLLRQACDGLHEAHLAGLIHRDLKPANIFSAYRGARYDVAKVLDFGLVKPTREDDSPALTREGMVTGSPLYMSPEQVTRSHSPDARTDIYALGGIAYYLLTGRAPFAGSDAMAVMIANARDPAPPPSTVRPGIPADLEQVVLRCLEKNPANRFQDAQALARAFSGCQDSQSWSDERAEAWWLANEPGILESPMGPASSHPVVESAELSHAADRLSTIGASAVEAVAESFNSGAASLTPSLIEGDLDTERPR